MLENNRKRVARCIKVAGIKYHKMEEHKWLKSEELGCDIGAQAFVNWSQLYGEHTRNWLSNLSDQQVDRLFKALPQRIKEKIYKKCEIS